MSEELGTALGIPVVVENNVRARAICASLFERSIQAEPFLYFFVSYGVACQIIIDGKALYGQSAAAGEIGHTVVQRGGPVCPTCGNRGCLEALTGERSVLQQCRDIMVAGGIVGRKLNQKMDNKAVDKLFIALMVVIVGICVYNSVRALTG